MIKIWFYIIKTYNIFDCDDKNYYVDFIINKLS